MEDEELVRGDGKLGVSAALVVEEFDLKHARCEDFDDGADLAA